MRAGILRHRVTIEAKTHVTDDWGEPHEEWSALVANLPAEVRDIRGREYWHSGQPAPVGEVTIRVRIRYRGDLDRQIRVVHAGRVYAVEAVLDPDGRRTELHIMCKELS